MDARLRSSRTSSFRNSRCSTIARPPNSLAWPPATTARSRAANALLTWRGRRAPTHVRPAASIARHSVASAPTRWRGTVRLPRNSAPCAPTVATCARSNAVRMQWNTVRHARPRAGPARPRAARWRRDSRRSAATSNHLKRDRDQSAVRRVLVAVHGAHRERLHASRCAHVTDDSHRGRRGARHARRCDRLLAIQHLTHLRGQRSHREWLRDEMRCVLLRR